MSVIEYYSIGQCEFELTKLKGLKLSILTPTFNLSISTVTFDYLSAVIVVELIPHSMVTVATVDDTVYGTREVAAMTNSI
jgi:hypothetical protein